MFVVWIPFEVKGALKTSSANTIADIVTASQIMNLEKAPEAICLPKRDARIACIKTRPKF